MSRFNPDDHEGVYGQKSLTHNFHLKRISSHKAMSLPSSPKHFANQSSLRGVETEFFVSPEMMATFNRVLESSNIPNKPLLPFEEWKIDISEIAIGSRVGIGMLFIGRFLNQRNFFLQILLSVMSYPQLVW